MKLLDGKNTLKQRGAEDNLGESSNRLSIKFSFDNFVKIPCMNVLFEKS